MISAALVAGLIIAAPFFSASAYTGNAIFDGKPLVITGWKYLKKLYRFLDNY
jgi:hypothetical protein